MATRAGSLITCVQGHNFIQLPTGWWLVEGMGSRAAGASDMQLVAAACPCLMERNSPGILEVKVKVKGTSDLHHAVAAGSFLGCGHEGCKAGSARLAV